MKAAVISFTEKGSRLADYIGTILQRNGYEVTTDVKCKYIPETIEESLHSWTGRKFWQSDAVIFVGAAAIAVRAAAPFIRSKTEDPAVLVMDEQGRFCIPLLSGHLGGANELAGILAEETGAQAVVTTATDLRNLWAVDVFAKKNDLWISDMKKAKDISVRLLAGERISVYLEKECCTVDGNLPEELYLYSQEQPYADREVKEPDIIIGIHNIPMWQKSLYLIPRIVTLGIGCKKGTEEATIAGHADKVFKNSGVFWESIKKAASIDLKKEEKGLAAFCRRYDLEFSVFSSEVLQSVEGDFEKSAFVKEVTGTDNVCERSAVYASGGNLIVRKQSGDGVTVAAAVYQKTIDFSIA